MGIHETAKAAKERRNPSPTRKRGLVVGLTLTGALIAGVLAATLPAVAQTDGDASGEESGDSETTALGIAAAIEGRLHEALAHLVADGTLTEAQSEAVVETLLAARRSAPVGKRVGGFDSRRPAGPIGLVSAELAELLGLDIPELRARLRSSETLAQVAGDAGVEVSAVVDVLVAAAVARVDSAIESGRLGSEDRESCLAALEVRIMARLSGSEPDDPADVSACGDREADGHGSRRGTRGRHGHGVHKAGAFTTSTSQAAA